MVKFSIECQGNVLLSIIAGIGRKSDKGGIKEPNRLCIYYNIQKRQDGVPRVQTRNLTKYNPIGGYVGRGKSIRDQNLEGYE